MARLTAKKLHGIWAGVTMCWDEQFRFDEETYAKNVQRCIAAKVAGVYTTGSTGEFYAIRFDEFKRMVDIVSDLCGKARMPLQIGCCADVTFKTIELMEYAAGKKAVGAAQVNIPYWMELDDRQMLGFFKDINAACPDLPIVHYNIPRAKRFLLGGDYRKVMEVCPSLIGVKFTFAGTHFGQLQDAMMATPDLSYFVAENLLVSAMQLGARGSCSSLVATNPKWTLKMYELASQRKWDQAIRMQQHASRFFNELAALIEERGEGTIDPVFDKGLAVASGCLLGHQRCRAPYTGWSDETVKVVRKWLQKNHPEFLFPG